MVNGEWSIVNVGELFCGEWTVVGVSVSFQAVDIFYRYSLCNAKTAKIRKADAKTILIFALPLRSFAVFAFCFRDPSIVNRSR